MKGRVFRALKGVLIALVLGVAVYFAYVGIASCGTNGGGDLGHSLEKNTIMDIGSEGCQPCRMLKPILEELEENHGDKVDFIFYEAWYTEEGAAMAEQFDVSAVPCIIFLDKSGREVKRIVGLKSYSVYEDALASLGWI